MPVFNNGNKCSTVESVELHHGCSMSIPFTQWHLYVRPQGAMPPEVWHAASKLTPSPIFHTLKFSGAAARVLCQTPTR